MAPSFEVITFDCYGTLVDWEAGIGAAFESIPGASLRREAVLREYARIEPLVQAEQFASYREVLRETSRRVVEALGGSIPSGWEDFLPESLPGWSAFPDTNPALDKLSRAGIKLGILSNVDDDLLSATCRNFSVRFDFTLTAQQVRSYKPSHGHFLAARRILGGALWLHAAQSYFHDVVPSTALGIPIAWINRKQEPLPRDGPIPTLSFPDLAALADHMTAR